MEERNNYFLPKFDDFSDCSAARVFSSVGNDPDILEHNRQLENLFNKNQQEERQKELHAKLLNQRKEQESLKKQQKLSEDAR